MNRSDLFARVHEALDARRDPLDDAEVRDALATDPEALVEFAALRERLAVLPALDTLPVTPPRARRWPWWLLAGTAAAAAAIALPVWRSAPPPPVGRVLTASLQPIRPTLGVVGHASARSVLLARPDARLETFVRWSAP